MSIQWTFIASLLYTEIFLVVLLMLPFISPARWQKIFKSRLLKAFHSYANLYFNIFIVLLVILFLDAVRDVRKYSATHDSEEVKAHPQAEVAVHMKLFRAQRNFYIAGFTLFLFLVLRRLVTLISHQATLQADCDTALKQAKSASETARKLMEDKDDNQKNEAKQQDSEELAKTKKELETSKIDLKRVQANMEAMKKQAESTNKEYDRLLEEHAKLQKEFDRAVGTEAVKKED